MNSRPDIRSEEILLMGLCRLSFGVELKVMLLALAEELSNWDYFCRLANEHGVASLVYNNIETLGFSSIPPEKCRSFLHNAHLRALKRNTENTLATIQALMILEEKGIRVVLLKGLALELSVYGKAGLRQMSDVDVLIAGEDCMKARQILVDNGFASYPVKSVLHKLILANTGKHLPTLVKNGFHFEIHHSLFGTGGSDLTGSILEDTDTIIADNFEFHIPGPLLHFLYLVRHLHMHEQNNESQLRLYTDLVLLLEKYREEILDYRLLDLAKQSGMDSILAWKLESLRDLWGLSFPVWINDFIDMNYSPQSINRFVYFLKSPKNNPPASRAPVYRQRVKEIPGLHRKIIFVAGDLLPTISFMKKRYGVSSSFAALMRYPHRLGKLWYLIKKDKNPPTPPRGG